MRPSARPLLARILVTLIGAVALLLAPAPARAEYLGFEDVSAGDWAAEQGYLDYVTSEGLMTGLSDTSFGPREPLSRARVVTVLWRVAGQPDAPEGTPLFEDCDYSDDSFYGEAVSWARAQGVVTGYSETSFGPADSVTREQLATMLARYAERVAGLDASSDGSALSAMADSASVMLWDGMAWAVDVGILTGDMSAGSPRALPQAPAQRDQAAKMLTVFYRDVLGAGDPQGPEFDDGPTSVELAPGVVEADGTVAEVTRSGELYGVRMEGMTSGVEPGDVVLLPPCEEFPFGTALKVSSVEASVAASPMEWYDHLFIWGWIPDVNEVFSNVHVNEELSISDLVAASQSASLGGISFSASPNSLGVSASLDLGDGIGLSGSFTISDFYAHVRLDTRDGGGSTPLDTQVAADVDFRCTVSPSISLRVSALPDELSSFQVFTLPIPCAGVKGLGLNFNVYVVVDVTGEVGLTASVTYEAGLEKGFEGEPRLSASVTAGDVEQRLALTGKVGVQPTIALELFVPILDLGVEAGAGASVERVEHPGLVCGNGSAWVYSNAFARLLKGFLGDDLRLTLDIFDEETSPFRLPEFHVENGARVPECTWKDTSERDEALASNPTVVRSTPSSQDSEVVTLTGTVRMTMAFDPMTGGRSPVYYLELPGELTVEGTQYGPITDSKVIAPIFADGGTASGHVGQVVSVRTGLSVRATASMPEAGVSMLWCNDRCELVRVFD